MDLKHQFITKLEMALFMWLLVLLLEISRALEKTLDMAIPWITQWLWAWLYKTPPAPVLATVFWEVAGAASR